MPSSHIRKIKLLLQDRGVVSTLRFLFGRLFFRRADFVVYESCLEELRNPSKWGKEELVLYYGPQNWETIDTDLFEFLGGDSALEYLEGLTKGDRLIAVKNKNQYEYFGFILFDTKQTRIIGEKGKVPLIANCFTRPESRGRGLYRRALIDKLYFLQRQGYRHAVIETHPSNIASRKGIESAGFRLSRELTACLICNKISVQFIKNDSRRKWHISLI